MSQSVHPQLKQNSEIHFKYDLTSIVALTKKLQKSEQIFSKLIVL